MHTTVVVSRYRIKASTFAYDALLENDFELIVLGASERLTLGYDVILDTLHVRNLFNWDLNQTLCV